MTKPPKRRTRTGRMEFAIVQACTTGLESRTSRRLRMGAVGALTKIAGPTHEPRHDGELLNIVSNCLATPSRILVLASTGMGFGSLVAVAGRRLLGSRSRLLVGA
jgi:hypothetical protein